jgi:hypothetical protein
MSDLFDTKNIFMSIVLYLIFSLVTGTSEIVKHK